MTLLVDPPSGWMYGFPKPFNPAAENILDVLHTAGYPEKDIPFALNYMRYIGSLEELEKV